MCSAFNDFIKRKLNQREVRMYSGFFFKNKIILFLMHHTLTNDRNYMLQYIIHNLDIALDVSLDIDGMSNNALP